MPRPSAFGPEEDRISLDVEQAISEGFNACLYEREASVWVPYHRSLLRDEHSMSCIWMKIGRITRKSERRDEIAEQSAATSSFPRLGAGEI